MSSPLPLYCALLHIGIQATIAYGGRRNETADATHLAEFHQVEGVVADYDITLGNLIGTWDTRHVNDPLRTGSIHGGVLRKDRKSQAKVQAGLQSLH